MNDQKILWVDVETSGLSPMFDTLLEVAAVMTDRNLKTINEFSAVIAPPNFAPVLMADEVRKMHLRSGLIEDILLEGQPLNEVEMAFRTFIWDSKGPSFGGEPIMPPLAGSSVHFDRNFLEWNFPWFTEEVSYRNIDVSTLKELAKRWYPTITPWESTGIHRALADVRNSIAELMYYREVMLNVPEPAFEHNSL
jgi:oligoribonuclease